MQVNVNRNFTFTGNKETRRKAATRMIDTFEKKQLLTPVEANYAKQGIVYPSFINFINGKPSALRFTEEQLKTIINPVAALLAKSRPIAEKVLSYYKNKGRI